MAFSLATDYFQTLASCLLNTQITDHEGTELSFEEGFSQALALILKTGERGKVLVIGNGGSAAIASHVHNDLCHSVGIRAMVFTEAPLLTALTNDHSYAEAYETQVQMWATSDDLLLAISSSGKSENILRAANAATAQQCAVYVDVRLTPVQNPLDVRAELCKLLSDAGLNGEVELFLYRPGYEADMQKAKPLSGAIARAHRALLGGEPGLARPNFSSMWRDVNCFNEMRIPALSYGPGVSLAAGTGNFSMKIDAMLTGAKLYALTALDLCSQPRDP